MDDKLENLRRDWIKDSHTFVGEMHAIESCEKYQWESLDQYQNNRKLLGSKNASRTELSQDMGTQKQLEEDEEIFESEKSKNPYGKS